MIERVDSNDIEWLKEKLEMSYNELLLFMENEIKPDGLSSASKVDYDKLVSLSKIARACADNIVKIRKIK